MPVIPVPVRVREFREIHVGDSFMLVSDLAMDAPVTVYVKNCRFQTSEGTVNATPNGYEGEACNRGRILIEEEDTAVVWLGVLESQ